jgi:energy-coupling factor transporter ATP-binding protein EcfA2
MTIYLDSLTYYYNWQTPEATRGVEQVSLEIAPGELVGVVGSSGAGKSCLLQCLAGVLPVTRGQINITGTGGLPKIGLVMQEPECHFFLNTVFEEVAFALTIQGRPKTEINRAVNRVLQQVGYDGDCQASPFRLSGGQQRRVALAGILIMEPELLLLDEPTVGLDATGLGMLRSVLTDFRNKQGTVLLVSHDQDFLYRQVNRVLLLKEGRLRADFSKQDWSKQADVLAKCGVVLPEVLQLTRRALPEEVRNYLKVEASGDA